MTLSKESHGKEFSNNMEKGPPRDTNAKFQKTANLVHLQLVNPNYEVCLGTKQVLSKIYADTIETEHFYF